jgi:hypothetical protein
MSNIFKPTIYKKENDDEKNNISNSNNSSSGNVFSNITFRNNTLGSIDQLLTTKVKQKKNRNKKNKNSTENILEKKIEVKAPILEKKEEERNINKEDIEKVLNSEDRGEELLLLVKNNNLEVESEYLVERILEMNEINHSWCDKDNYGNLLEFLLKDKIKEQLKILLQVEKYCNKLNFPKIIHNEKEKYLIDLIFYKLLINEIVDERCFDKFLELEEEEDEKDRIRKRTFLQIGEFIIILQSLKYEEEEEEKEEEKEELTKEEKEKLLKEEKERVIKEKNKELEELMTKEIDEDFNIDDI